MRELHGELEPRARAAQVVIQAQRGDGGAPDEQAPDELLLEAEQVAHARVDEEQRAQGREEAGDDGDAAQAGMGRTCTFRLEFA